MTEFAKLPQAHRPKTVRGMVPYEIFYPPQEILTFDTETQEVIIYTTSEFEKDDSKPKRLLGRIGIVRAFGTGEDGTTVDGYVVDIRHTKGNLESDDYSGDTPDDVEEQNYWFAAQKDRIKISGLIHDDEGRLTYSGEPALHSQAMILAEYTDSLLKKLKKEDKKKKVKEVEAIPKKEKQQADEPS